MSKPAPVILIIDDQISNFDVIEILLSQDNYELFYASSGPKAFSLIRNINPDLILLDVMMPEMDGIEVCKRLKSDSNYKHIPILMVTALNTKEDLARCLEEGADDFLSKPIDSLELKARMRSLLRVKHQYDELQKMIQLREETLQMREDMSRMIVHDLRNPLSSMMLSTEIALRYIEQCEVIEPPPLKPKILNKLKQILNSGKQVKKMVEDLLLMSKLEAGKMHLNLSDTNIQGLSLEVIKEFEEMAHLQNINLQLQLPDRQVNYQVDSGILRRVLDNLLSNALKFSPSHSTITVSIENLPEHHLRIQVTDQGPGINPEDRQSIFEKYEIGSLKSGALQIGLGLAFCKLAIEAHGGTLAIADHQPRGAILIVEI